MEWMTLPLRRYADFSGRSRRKEYWMFVLLTIIASSVLILLGFTIFGFANADPNSPSFSLLGYVPFMLFYLAILIPTIAVQVRRLHDRDMSGWWLLGFYICSAIPVVGFLVSIGLLVLMCLPGTIGPNRYGPDPKDPHGREDIDRVFS